MQWNFSLSASHLRLVVAELPEESEHRQQRSLVTSVAATVGIPRWFCAFENVSHHMRPHLALSRYVAIFSQT